MRFTSIIKQKAASGFTLVEVLIIAPVVILVISGFVALIVVLVGDVLAVRDRNNMSYEIRDSLDRIEQDVRISTQFLVTSSTLQSPQGSNNNFTGTAAFSNSNSLILGTLTTDKNPVDSTRQLIYYAKQPNDCGSALLSYNRAFISKVIYFIKDGSLWRRSYLLPYNTTASPANDETVCSTPWQQNSCSPGYTAPRCQTSDQEVMKNVSSFSVKYYASPQSTTELGAANALNASSVEVRVNGSKTIAGRTVTNTSSVRVNKLNNIDADLPIPASPTPPGGGSGSAGTISGVATGTTNTANFSWDPVPSATSYLISYNINGGPWIDATNDSFTTNFVVTAYRNDTVTLKVAAKNSSGTSSYSQAAATMPAWNACNIGGGWTNYLNTYATAGFTETSTGIVHMKGLIKNGSTSVGTVLCTLPPGFRPNAKLIFLTSSNGVTNGIAEGAPARIDVATNGDVILDYGGNSSWIDLDMIRFVASDAPYTWNTMTTENSWVNYGFGYSDMQYSVDSIGRVQLQGLLKNGNYTDWTIATRVPAALRPSQFMNFATASSTAFNNFGVANGGSYGGVTARGLNGQAYWQIQGRYYPYTFNSWTGLSLQNSWVAFDAVNYAPPSYTKASDGVVTVRGLIKNGTYAPGTVIANLPAGYRPAERQIYTCTANGSWSRVDVLPNGNIEIRAAYNGWISLDTMTFLAEQ
jgi:hypothetical protein